MSVSKEKWSIYKSLQSRRDLNPGKCLEFTSIYEALQHVRLVPSNCPAVLITKGANRLANKHVYTVYPQKATPEKSSSNQTWHSRTPARWKLSVESHKRNAEPNCGQQSPGADQERAHRTSITVQAQMKTQHGCHGTTTELTSQASQASRPSHRVDSTVSQYHIVHQPI